jgi:hypothetical protein
LIRNALIEHKEGSGRHEQSVTWGIEDGRGPVLKGWGFDSDETGPDQGLFRNAEVMRARLEAALISAIAKVNNGPAT